jgi:hypothetical protein
LHRDIKPENIKVERLSSGRLQAKIIDFGLARAGLTARKQTESGGTVMGSIYYMAPEQLTRRPTDQRTDLYSLGCVLYEAVSGKKAFDAKTVTEVIQKHVDHDMIPIEVICPHLPQWLTYWINRLMAKNPKDRPSSAQQAIDELRAWEMLPPSPHGTGFVPMQYQYHTTGVVPPGSYPTTQQAPITGSHTHYVPQPQAKSVTGKVQKIGPSTAVQQRQGKAAKKLVKRSWTWLWVLIFLMAAAALVFYFLNNKATALAKETIDLTGATQEELKAYDQLFPAVRPFPVLDQQRVMHFVAGVNTRAYRKGDDGLYIPTKNHNKDIVVWDDITSRGGNTYLRSLKLDDKLSPRILSWDQLNKPPAGYRTNNYVMDFGYSAQVPLGMKAQGHPSMAEFFPFGKSLDIKAQGVTVGAVFMVDPKRSPMTVLRLSDKEDKYRIMIRTLNNGKLIVDFENTDQPQSEWRHKQMGQLDTRLPIAVVARWSQDLGVHVTCRDAKGTHQENIGKMIVVPKTPLTDLMIGSDSQEEWRQYHGLVSEVVVYSTALSHGQTAVLLSGFVRQYMQQ